MAQQRTKGFQFAQNGNFFSKKKFPLCGDNKNIFFVTQQRGREVEQSIKENSIKSVKLKIQNTKAIKIS